MAEGFQPVVHPGHMIGSDAPKKIRAIIFDLDGTIVDTEILASRIVTEVFGEVGVALTAEDSKAVTGRRFDAALAFLFDRHLDEKVHGGDTAHEAHPDQITRRILTRYRAAIEVEIGTVPGAVEAVKEYSQHYPLALVTGSSHHEVDRVMNHLKIRDCFKCIYAAEDYEWSKPDPDGFNRAIQELGVKPSETLVFEDSTPGIQSALSAGAWVAAITSTNHFGFDQSKAHWHIENFNEIDLKWIQSRGDAMGEG